MDTPRKQCATAPKMLLLAGVKGEHYGRPLAVSRRDHGLMIKGDTIYRRIVDKQMPTYRVGRLWKSRKEEIDKWSRVGGAVENK